MATPVTNCRCSGPRTRRDLLRAGALAIGGLSLQDVLAAREEQETRRDTSVILLYLHGGPSHLETYDLKPDAPEAYRSVFRPIETRVSGMQVCEHLPLHARQAHRFALIRSLHHDVDIHSDGGIVVLTGKRPAMLDPTSRSRSEHPDFGSIAGKMRGPGPKGLPPYVAIPRGLYMTRPAYLGIEHGPFEAGDPSGPGYGPEKLSLGVGKNLELLLNRRRLLERLDRFRAAREPGDELEQAERYRRLAFELLTSPEVARAFDVGKEPEALRDRYGRHRWGQGCLLARRLAEAGVAAITVYVDSPASGPDFTNWDDHILNAGRPGHFGDYMKRRLPYLDQALAGLIEDVYDRGLDRKILILAVGEFGRTPRVKQNTSGTGRDHWPQAYSALVSGGGLRVGQAIGATNEKGEHPVDRPYTPQDLLATIYRHLGIDTALHFTDHTGRPVPVLFEGTPIPELC